MSATGSDHEDENDPAKITRDELRQLREIAKEYRLRKELEDRKDKERKRNWKTSDVGFFWPDLPTSHGTGRVVDYDGNRYFRDVNSFISQLKDTIGYYGPETVANNIQNCLKGQAFVWYSDILPATTKRLLRLDIADDCKTWTDALAEAFRLSGSEAMKKISSNSTQYTMHMLKTGVSLVNWFTDMVSLANDAEFGKDKQTLRFIWFKMDAELRAQAPRLLETHTIQSYLGELRNAEEGMREAIRAQDQRIASEMRSSQWRQPQSRPYWNKQPATPPPRTYDYTQNRQTAPPLRTYDNTQEQRQPQRLQIPPNNANQSRDFTQYLPAAMKSLEITPTRQADTRSGSGAGNMGKSRDWSPGGQRPGSTWNNRALGQRRDSYRVNPKRTCVHCGGWHYDSMCNMRNAATPRVHYSETENCYIVEETGDTEYDYQHQEFVNSFFTEGRTIDDFYRLCLTGEETEDDGYVIDCGLAEASPIRTYKSAPTTAVHNAKAVTFGKNDKVKHRDKELTIHHVTEARHACKRCPASFRKRNKLFAHLRDTNHYMASADDAPTPTDIPTPNDPSHESDPEVVKSSATATFGTGYGFRTYNYLEMRVRLAKHGPDTWVCLDTGAGMSLIDRQWLTELCPDAMILTRATDVSVRGIDNKTQKTSNYVVLQVYIPGHDENDGKIKLAEIRREFHIVPELRCKMIIGEDIIEPEGMIIDSSGRKATIKSCSNFNFKLQITPKGQQILHRRVTIGRRTTVSPGARTAVPIRYKQLPADRDYEFTPVYNHHTAYLSESGGFLRAVLDNQTDCIIYHNRSEHTVVIQKDLRVGFIADFTPETYCAHASFLPYEHPELFDAAEVGQWQKEPVEATGRLHDDVYASRRSWQKADTRSGFTDAMHNGVEHIKPNPGNDSNVPPMEHIDINSTDEITPAQQDAVRRTVARFALLFENRGTVALEPEEDYMRITLKPGAELVNRRPYNNSAKDRGVIDTTFDKYHYEQKMGWSRPGMARGANPAFVVWQKDQGRVVLDIRALNASVWKDPYPMPRQEDILQAIKGCHWLTTLDLTAAFMQRSLHKDSRHLVTVVSHRGLEYFKVAPFGFTNSPAHMQRFMDNKLRNLRDFVRCYIDDIVIFSRTFEEHLEHLASVFRILEETRLYLSPKKCHLAYHSVKLLGRMVDSLGLSTLKERAAAVQNLQFPKTLQQLESIIGAANYNRSHIPYYAALIAPLEQLKRELLREAPKKGSPRKRFTAKCSLEKPSDAHIISFEGIKEALSGPNTLIHYDSKIPLVVRIDASKQRGYGAMIAQIPVWSYEEPAKSNTLLDPTANGYNHDLERPVCYLSKRLNKHELNYWPTELEVAGLVWTIRKIRHLVDDSEDVVVFTDHQATTGIVKQTDFRNSTPHKQNLRLVRASLYLSQFPQIRVLHVPGRLNIIPDALSRLEATDEANTGGTTTGDHADIYDTLHLQASMLRISDDFIDKIQKGYNHDPYFKSKFAEMKRIYSKTGKLPVVYNNLHLEDAELHAFTPQAKGPVLPGSRRYLLYLVEGDKLRLCVPRAMVVPFLQMAHDKNNHAGFERTYQRLRQSYFMKGASTTIKDYIKHCPSCLINKPTNYTPSGRLIPITAPASPWELITVDFVVKLPACTPKSGLWKQLSGKDLPAYDSFLSITDKLTKYVVLVAGCEKWTAEEWATRYYEKVFHIFGVPAAMISDRGSVFVSQFWTTIFQLMKTDCVATTAYNPRSDGQSERTHQVVEIALRHCVNANQDDWVHYLSEIQFAMNNSINASTGATPADLLMGYTPRGAIDIPAAHITWKGQAASAVQRAVQIKMQRQEAQDAIKLAEFTMASTYDKGHRISDIRAGDRVFINFAKRTESGYSAAGVNAPKLGPQRVGPFLVIEMVGENACRVDIPGDWKIWPVISVRHLVKAPSTPDTFTREPIPHIRPEEPVNEVEEVLDSRLMRGRKEFWVKYVGLPITRNEWKLPEEIEHARNKIEAFELDLTNRAPGKRKRTGTEDVARKKKAN
jgi:hypothetical protein